MTLDEIISALEGADPTLTLPHGFTNPHSYRGYYDELAFEPATNVTVADMLANARSALGTTYTGWKGGEFTMRGYTDCWLAQEGSAGGETLGPLLLDFMLAAGIRDAARQASGQQPDDEPVVAYWNDFPHSTLYCPEHGKDRPGLIPRTSDDLPFGGNCHTCGRDVLILAAPDPTIADDPTPLRWGLGDVLHSDDDTVIVCLSGPDREPYWLELDPERAAALRNDLADPHAPAAGLSDTQPANDEARPSRQRWCVEGYDADEWNPVSRTFTNAQDAHARKRVSQRYPDMPTRVVRETTTWTVEEDETR